MAISFELEIDGLDRLINKMETLYPKVNDAVEKALYQFAEEVMAASVLVVPVGGTGALMGTGKVLSPEREGTEISVTMGYGDESVGYALYVHENMNANVNWTRPGSGPQFLAQPLHERQDQLPGKIADAVREAMGE